MESYFNIRSDLVFWTLMSGLREEDEQVGQRNVDERSNKLRLDVATSQHLFSPTRHPPGESVQLLSGIVQPRVPRA